MSDTDAASLINSLDSFEKEAQHILSDALSEEQIEQARVNFLGKKGHISLLLRKLGSLSADDRPSVGAKANSVRQNIETWIDTRLAAIEQNKRHKELSQVVDTSLPGKSFPCGSLHPITQTSERILAVLNRLGFQRVSGPEIEHDFFNFEALNIPKSHPARDMQDTFYIEDDIVLRTHTSPVQVRTMLAQKKPPMRVVSFGRVYRRDHDVTHSPMFHQIEGLYIDKNVTFADLKATVKAFIEGVFSAGCAMRMRPSYFPFTEPSAEIDMACFECKGKGCRLCKNTGWIEIMGAGMIDPNVLRAARIDPEEYSGFAFGLGVERVSILEFGIPDIRLLFENSERFLSQF